MVMTRRGIFHNLSDSNYAVSNSEIALFFSSRFYLNNFLERYTKHREEFNTRLSRAMVIDEMELSLMADLHLYRDIETKGQYMILSPNLYPEETVRKNIKEGVISWQNAQKYALVKMTKKNMLDWSEMQKQNLDDLKRITDKI